MKLLFFLSTVAIFFGTLLACEEPTKYNIIVKNYANVGYKQKVVLKYKSELSEINTSLVNINKIYKDEKATEEVELEANVSVKEFDRDNQTALAEVVFIRSELILLDGKKKYLFVLNKPYTMKFKGEDIKVFFEEKELKYEKQLDLIKSVCSISFDKGWYWVKDISVGQTVIEKEEPKEIPGLNSYFCEYKYTLESVDLLKETNQKVAIANNIKLEKYDALYEGKLKKVITNKKNTSKINLSNGILYSQIINDYTEREELINAPDCFNESSFKAIFKKNIYTEVHYEECK